MYVELTRDEARLEELVPSWSQLAQNVSWPNVFYEPWFVLSAIESLSQDVVHAFVWDNSRENNVLIGYMPFSIIRFRGHTRPRRVENWNHEYCFLGEPLIAENQETVFWSNILKKLDESPELGTTIRIRGMSKEANGFKALSNVLKEQKRWNRVYRRYERAILHHSSNADTYLQSKLTKKKRKEFGRLRRRLEEVGVFKEEVLQDPSELNGWIDDFLKLEDSGWKGRQESSFASSRQSEQFFRRLATRAFEQQKMHMLKLSVDNKPVAMLVTFQSKPLGSFEFKTAYDEAFSRYSPGVLLEVAYLRRALDDNEQATRWTDSCAAADHPMINRIWRDRFSLVSIKIAPNRSTAKIASIYDDIFSRAVNRLKTIKWGKRKP